jgi:hypothetical protein
MLFLKRIWKTKPVFLYFSKVTEERAPYLSRGTVRGLFYLSNLFASSYQLNQISKVTLLYMDTFSKLQNVLLWECVVKHAFVFSTVTAMV